MAAIADMIELKFTPMFAELPGTIVGVYGEAFGYSKQVVHAHINKLLDDYDALNDEAKACVDRVANYFVNIDSPLRMQMQSMVGLGSTLKMFPDLFYIC